MPAETLAVVGTLLTMILGINAYFIKQLVDNINDTKINVAILVTQNTSRDAELIRINGEINELKIFDRTMSHRVVSLEVQNQVRNIKNEEEN